MDAETLAQALEREHHEIDTGIEQFSRALSALRRHIYLEEEEVFPPLDAAGLVAPIYVMLREHGEIWQTMDAIDELCRQLLEQLERHNSKEEAIIYPQAEQTLDAELDAKLRSFLADGAMPQGWRPTQHRAQHQ